MMHFTIWIEKILGKGEDAPPTCLLSTEGQGVLAVYDGLGGAGSKTYPAHDAESGAKTHSGAYLASRLAKQTVENFFELAAEEASESISPTLTQTLKQDFKDYQQKIEQAPSRLRSKLIKTLPTTLAGIHYRASSEENLLEITSFWAGDSRCYILYEQGLKQISWDDLHGEPDALENLTEDATISNCVHAEGNFVLHEQVYFCDEPCVLITATDGCFAYLSSPAHFEYILLHTLMRSYYDGEDWKEKLQEQLCKYAADDVSLSLICWGFSNLNELKNRFYHRYQELTERFITPLEDLQARLKSPHLSPQDKIITSEEERRALLVRLWEDYKQAYYSLLFQEEQ